MAQIEATIRYSILAVTKETEFDAPDSWKLFDRREVLATLPDGSEETLFYERWLSASKKGLAAYRMIGTGGRCSQGHTHALGEAYYLVKEYADRVGPGWATGSVAVKQEFGSEESMRTAMTCIMEGWNLVPQPENRVEAVSQFPQVITV
ncbi:MAG: hypothetical protein JRN62_03355 [Nitrososphaerota archaeon]|jgi:hypothetical protein|nr:hypothetical protein [Nitrososphaerota archaeon]MDG6948635.1 hypothetical protein [Nitrososphaerota archaeon]